MNWIGLKHLVLQRIERFLFRFIPCRHLYSIYMDQQQQSDCKKILDSECIAGSMKYTAYCKRCDRPATIYLGKEISPDQVAIRMPQSGTFHDKISDHK